LESVICCAYKYDDERSDVDGGMTSTASFQGGVAKSVRRQAGFVMTSDCSSSMRILHNWPDAEAMAILRNIRNAMKPNSRVLIHDCVLFRTVQDPGVGVNQFSVAPQPMLPNFGAGSHRVYQLDMAMWFIFNAKERTLDEFKTLGLVVGLAFTQVYDLVDTMLIEFRIAQN